MPVTISPSLDAPVGNPELNEQLANIDDSRVPSLIMAWMFCLVAAYFAVSLRILARRMKQVPFLADDWTIFASLLPATALAGLSMYLTRLGYGRHEIVVTDSKTLSLVRIQQQQSKLHVLLTFH